MLNNLNLKLKLKKPNEINKKLDERVKTQYQPFLQNQQQPFISHHKKLTKLSLVSKIVKTQNNESFKQKNDDRKNKETKNMLKILPNDKKSMSNTMKMKLKNFKTEYNQEKSNPIMLNNRKYHKDFSLANNKREILAYQKYDKIKSQWSYHKDVKIQRQNIELGRQRESLNKDRKSGKINLIKQNSTQLKLNVKRELIGQERYIVQQQAGSGTFGVVHKARDRQNMEIVAIKKVFQDKNYKNRQHDIMKILNHPNIIKMKDSYFTYSKQKQYLNIVMDYYPLNLSEYIYQQKKNRDEIFWLKFKVLTFYMLKALLYLDIKKIAHRDLKPHNILLDTHKFSLIICDFGSAKLINPVQNNLAYICSRSYRAPQLILGNTKYSTPVDMWSIGCILVEMVIGETLFKAKNNLDQLMQIIKILGSPNIDQIRQMNPECEAQKFKFPKIKGLGLQKFLQTFTNDLQLLDLLKKMMSYSPKTRLSPFEGLKHNYFKILKEQKFYNRLFSQIKMQKLLDFTWLDDHPAFNKHNLTPSWYKI